MDGKCDTVTEIAVKSGTGGAVSIKDSSWCNGLFPGRVGDYVKKPMPECTGEEILTEFCCHLGLAAAMLDAAFIISAFSVWPSPSFASFPSSASSQSSTARPSR